MIIVMIAYHYYYYYYYYYLNKPSPKCVNQLNFIVIAK